MNLYLTTFIFSMLLTIVLIPVFCGIALRTGIFLDVPNDRRKIHQHPTPRIGGFAMTLGIIAPLLFWVEVGEYVKAVLLGAGVIVVFGLVDDIRGIRFRVKFAGQFIAAFLVIFWGGLEITDLGTILPGASSLAPFLTRSLTAFVIVGVTNAINLSDGLDGLAGGICMLSFMAIAYFAHSLGEGNIFLLSLSVSGAIFGFLRFNTYPASIFMGDTGSQLLGFLAVTLSLGLTQTHGPVSPYVPLLIIGFPVLDTIVVMFERIAAGKSPFIADKNHLHHKLINIGFYHSEAVICIYLIQTVFVSAAYLFRFYTDWFVLSYYLIFSVLVLSPLVIAERYGYRIKRFYFFDKIIKGKLRTLKENNLLIKIAFKFVFVSVPLLLFFSCFGPAHLPGFFGKLSLGVIIVLLGVVLMKKEWLSHLIRIVLFIAIPFIIYFSEVDSAEWVSGPVRHFYNAWEGVTVLFILLTMKLTRRSDGLKATPLHFLILFLTMIIPNLSGGPVQNFHLGTVAVKIIFFFFGIEVLIGELRNNMKWLGFVTVLCFVVLAVRVSMGL